jgi:NADPH2:quinone reductase
MRALLSEHTGPSSTLVLREIPEPQPKAGEVRIKVHACGINYPDVLIIEDKYQFRQEFTEFLAKAQREKSAGKAIRG